MLNRLNLFKLIFVTGCFLFTVSLAWAVPGTINYQGVLTDSGGSTLSGDVSIDFRLFDAATAGTELWNETQTVTVQNGLYAVQLGGMEPIVPTVFASGSVWLETEISGEVLSPRQFLNSVPYALQAASVEDGGLSGGQIVNNVSIGPSDVSESYQLKVTGDGASRSAGYFDAAYSGSLMSFGLRGENILSGSGMHYGVYGLGANSTTVNVGTYGLGEGTEATANYGLYGFARYSTHDNYGVYGAAVASGTTGVTYGVYGSATGPSSTTSGRTYGVYGTASGGYNFAGYFNGDAAVTDTLMVGTDVHDSFSQLKVVAAPVADYAGTFVNNNTAEGYSYAIRGIASGHHSEPISTDIHYGVHGEASGGYTNRGVEGYVSTNDGHENVGVRAFAQGGTTNYGLYASSGNPTRDYAGYFYGNVHVTGTLSEASDLRLKENILPVENALEKVQAMNGVYFNFKTSPDKTMVGVIAQEVQAVLPEVVSVTDPETGYLGVSYTSLVPLLIEAVKELKTQNEALQARIEVLEGGTR